MAAVNDIRDKMVEVIEDLAPIVHPGTRFVRSEGSEALARMPQESAWHRSFRVIDRHRGAPDKYFGGGSIEIADGVLELHVGYLSGLAERDLELDAMMTSDLEQIAKATQLTSQTWPDSLANLELVDSREVELDAGRNAVVLEIEYRLRYCLQG